MDRQNLYGSECTVRNGGRRRSDGAGGCDGFGGVDGGSYGVDGGVDAKSGDVGQLEHLATRTVWAQQVFQQENIEVRRISRTENSADCLTSHNSSQDLRAVVQMGGTWPGAQLGENACFLAAHVCSMI